MSAAEVFLDTNVLLYLISDDPLKAQTAETVLLAGATVGVQVLNEFAAVAARKQSLSWHEIGEVLDVVKAACTVTPMSLDIHERALTLAARYGYHLYDSLILAAALAAGCGTLLSEDMQDGQVIDGALTIRNPFRP